MSDGKKVALVVGITHYEHTYALSNAVPDALKMKEVLETELGFDGPPPGQNCTLAELSDLLTDYDEAIENADTALLFFAGHGVQVEGRNYLLPSDCPFRSVRHFKNRGISLNELASSLQARARTSILLLDACQERIEQSHGRRTRGSG